MTQKFGTIRRWEVALRRTRRRETQRYRCRQCGRTFSARPGRGQRYASDLLAESVKRHLEDRSSFRVIAKRLSELTHRRFGRMTGHRALTRAAQACKTPVDVAHELTPQWAGYLHLDGKGIKLKGLPAYAWTAFLAQDSTGDVVHVALFEGGEQREAIRDFLLVIRDQLHYPIRGVISDLREEIFWAVQQVWPGLPHQGCLTHTLRLLDTYTDYLAIRRRLWQQLQRWRRWRDDTPILHRQQPWYHMGVRQIRQQLAAIKQAHAIALRLRRRARIWLSSRTPEQSEDRWGRFQRTGTSARSSQERALVHSLRTHRAALRTYLDHPEMPWTNNRIENLIKQLNRRLKTLEGFGSPQQARGYLYLWSVYHRFKPYTDCRGRHRYKNGKAPLACAGVDLTGLDWFTFSQKTNS